MRFAHLHGHSSYSFLDGYGTPKQVVSRIAELGHSAAAVTDHGNIYAHVPFQTACVKAGVRPVFGCEFYVVDDMTARTRMNPSLGASGAPHVTVLAATQRGYHNLISLFNVAHSDGFYYKPRVDWPAIARRQEGLVVLSGCVGGYPSRLVNKFGPEAAHKFVAQAMQRIERFYVELIPQPGLGISEAALPWLMKIARDLGAPTVMTADAHFPRPEDHDVQDLLLCVGIGKRLADKTRELRLPAYQFYCSAKELLERACLCLGKTYHPEAWIDEIVKAIETSADVAESCSVEIPKAAPMAFPGLARPAEQELAAWAVAGARERLAASQLSEADTPRYLARAQEELDLFARKGFCDYILSVADLIKWCKSQGGLVMCRGSAGGCLLLWLLGASETDSIAHDLSFERFFDETRSDPPDIDVDFEQQWRGKVIQYVFEKYGAENSSQIAALSLQRAKSALHDACFAYGIPYDEVAPLSAILDSKDDDVETQVERMSDPAALAVLKRHPELRVIDRMVGQSRQSTIHAAGVIISSEPLSNSIGVLAQPGKPPVSSVDKHGAADLGFLKIDLLAVSAFDVTAEAARRAGVSTETLYRLKLDDPKVYETARRGAVAGVFQLDGAALRVGLEVGLDTFEDLYACSALCRPGPAEFVPLYKKNKSDPAAFQAYLASVHPKAAAVVKKTFGVLLYQEQVMRLCRELTGMPWPRVQQLRKRIANASFNARELGGDYEADFVEGAVANGCSREEAGRWWHAVKTHGVYSFNAAHCVTYGIVGYWMLWLKTYYPGEYYEQFLRLEGAAEGQTNELLMKRLVREFRALGGELSLPTPQEARESFYSPRPGRIVGGWGNVKGVGASTAARLKAAGPFASWSEAMDAMPNAAAGQMFSAGWDGRRPFDPQATAALAPWLPISFVKPQHDKFRRDYNALRPGDLVDGRSGEAATACGYVTAAHKKNRTGSFRGDQIIYVLEDETGQAVTRVPQKKLGELGARMKNGVKVGDFAAVEGWWSGDTFYARDFYVVSRIGKDGEEYAP